MRATIHRATKPRATKTPSWLPPWQLSGDGELAALEIPGGGMVVVAKGETAGLVGMARRRFGVTLRDILRQGMGNSV
jgi:hypothetical protein